MDNQKEIKKTETKGRGLFYGVIAIATFIIMAVGATFAYFTATTNSASSAVTTGSTTLKLDYISYGSAWMKNDLIPADTEVVEYSFESQDDTTGTYGEENESKNSLCKDDYDNSICSVYVFQVSNTANSPQVVSLNVVSEENDFKNLNAMAYELKVETQNNETYESEDSNNKKNDPIFKKNHDDHTENSIEVTDGEGKTKNEGEYTPIYVNRKGVTKTLLQYIDGEPRPEVSKKPAIDRQLVEVTDLNRQDVGTRTAKIADDITIAGGEIKTFALVLYIKNLEEDQTTDDAAKNFKGQMVVSSGDGSTGVSGTITALQGQEGELQSKKQD